MQEFEVEVENLSEQRSSQHCKGRFDHIFIEDVTLLRFDL